MVRCNHKQMCSQPDMTMLVKYLHFVKSKLEGMANTILSPLKLLQQKDLFQKSNPRLKNFCTAVWNSSWWEGRDFDWRRIYETKTHYIYVTVFNFHCQQQVFNIQFNCDCANNKGKNAAYFQFISLSSRIWCIQASRLLEINELWKINLFCNPFPSIYNVNEKELALRKEKWWKRVHYL